MAGLFQLMLAELEQDLFMAASIPAGMMVYIMLRLRLSYSFRAELCQVVMSLAFSALIASVFPFSWAPQSGALQHTFLIGLFACVDHVMLDQNNSKTNKTVKQCMRPS